MTGIFLLTAVLGATTQIDAVAVETDGADAKSLGLVSAYRNVAMMPLSSLGSTGDVLQAIERVLVGEVGKLLGGRLIKPEDLPQAGDPARVGFLECDGVVGCLVEVVGGLGWDAFVVGNIAGLGGDRVLNIKLIDVRTGGEVRRASAEVTGEETELIKQMRRAAVTLLAPDLLVGTLDLQCPQPEVEILIDGKLAGTTPMKNTKVEVPVGRHAVEAKGEGLVPFSTLVDVAYGEMAKVNIALPRNTVFVGGETPFRSRWWTWAIASAGVIAVGLGGYFNYLQADTVRKIESRAKKGTLTSERADLYDESESHWSRARVFYGVGGALLGGVTVLFTIDLL